MKPNLLHVFPCFAGGGPEVRTTDLINRTSHQFHHVVASLNGDCSGWGRVEPTQDAECIDGPHKTIRSMRSMISSLSPDAVFTYGWGGVDAILAARLAGIRRVVHMEDGFLEDERSKQKPARLIARRLVFKMAERIVVPSQTLVSIALREWKVPKRKLLFIPNGIDGKRFHPVTDQAEKQRIRAELGIPTDATVIGTVGGLRPEKNQMQLLKAFAKILAEGVGLHLLIVGDGPLLMPMKNDASLRGITDQVTFFGASHDPARHYRAMDVFALSSDTEQMPLVVLEAMATGLPVVSTDVGDIMSMVANSNSPYVVELHDHDRYSTMLSILAMDPALCEKIGKDNRQRFDKDFTMSQMIESYCSLYHGAD